MTQPGSLPVTRDLLSDDQLTSALVELPGVWRGPLGSIELAVQAPSFPAAVRLIELVAEHAEAMDHHPDVDLRWRTVTFTVATHSAGGVTGLDLELARRILAVAATTGATVTIPDDRLEIALDCVDAAAVRRFWQAALGYREQAGDDDGPQLLPRSGRGPSLWFQPMDPPRTDRDRFHLDVYLPAERIQERIAAVLAAGGRLVSDQFAPSWWVLADPEGNEVCLCSRQ